ESSEQSTDHQEQAQTKDSAHQQESSGQSTTHSASQSSHDMESGGPSAGQEGSQPIKQSSQREDNHLETLKSSETPSEHQTGSNLPSPSASEHNEAKEEGNEDRVHGGHRKGGRWHKNRHDNPSAPQIDWLRAPKDEEIMESFEKLSPRKHDQDYWMANAEQYRDWCVKNGYMERYRMLARDNGLFNLRLDGPSGSGSYPPTGWGYVNPNDIREGETQSEANVRIFGEMAAEEHRKAV